MEILKIIFFVFVTMAAVYTIFNIKDFFISWYKWILLLFKGIWNLIKWLWSKIISLFKKG